MNGLRIENLSKSFGGVQVLNDVSFDVLPGKLTSLIGPNGAGKSTLANIVSGFLNGDSGEIWLDEVRVTKMPTYKRARRGLSRTFQNLELFKGLTVRENAVLGGFTKLSGLAIRNPLTSKINNQTLSTIAEQAMQDLSISNLAEQHVDSLGFGNAKNVEPVRVLTAGPTVLVMDEPAAGLSSSDAKNLGLWLRELTKKNIAILLIEHNMNLVMDISDHIVVLDHGELIAKGSPQEIRTNQKVIDAYLGQSR